MIIPVDFAQVNLIFTGPGVPTGAEVTFGVDNSVGSYTAALLADAVDTAFSDSFVAFSIAEGVNLTSIKVKKGPNATGAMFIEPSGNDGQGDPTGAPNLAFLIRKETAIGGRAGRGRMFLPGVPETSVDPGGQITSTAVTNLQGQLDNFLLELEGVDLPLVVLHSAGSPISTPTPITGLSVQTTGATQRQRLRR